MANPTPTPDRPPLWRVMERASADAEAAYYPFASSERVLAAEIRAVRDEIERWQIENYAVVLTDVREVLAWLSSQADRAERGDG